MFDPIILLCRCAWQRRPALAIASVLLGSVQPATAIQFRLIFDCFEPNQGFYCIYAEPAISPSGSCIAFTNGTVSPPWYEWWPSVQFVPVDAGSCALAYPWSGLGGWFSSPAWSADGAHLAFTAEGYNNAESGIWTVDVGDLQEPPSSRRRVAAGPYTDAAWSLDGASIACVSYDGIYVVASNGGTPVLTVPDGRSPSWGPDGDLAFARGGDLWIRRADGSERQLTNTPYDEGQPAWFA